VRVQDDDVHPPPVLHCIRIDGELGITALSAFPAMVHQIDGGETVLTGLLKDRSALFGAIAEIESLGLELIEVRRVRPSPPLGSDGPRSLDPS
jgi:hypothetical protein